MCTYMCAIMADLLNNYSLCVYDFFALIAVLLIKQHYGEYLSQSITHCLCLRLSLCPIIYFNYSLRQMTFRCCFFCIEEFVEGHYDLIESRGYYFCCCVYLFFCVFCFLVRFIETADF